jgi:uncharacterized protein (UPF0147 family)
LAKQDWDMDRAGMDANTGMVIGMGMEKDELKPVITMLEQIMNDRTVPRNIRAAAENSKAALSSNEENPEVKISTAIQILDEIINDPNMPMYTRTQIWNVVSMLEEKRRELS